MKTFCISLLLSLGLALTGCGGGSSNGNSGNINGTWTATLTDPNNTTGPAFAFGTSFTQTGGNGVSVTNLTFTTEDSCFGTAGTETGSFTLSGDFNGNVTGIFSMTIQSASPSGNTLTLSNGAVAGNKITGTWVLTGPGCNGSGTFTMTKM